MISGSASFGADKLGEAIFPKKYKGPKSSSPYQLKKQIFKGVKASYGATADIHIDQAIDKLKGIFSGK